MCTLTKRIEKKKVVVGYKVAIKNDAGEYLSPATIIKYAVGKIPEISYSEKWKRKRNKICDFFCVAILDKFSTIHKENYNGKTGVFVNYPDALSLFVAIKEGSRTLKGTLVILQMKISGNLYEGEYKWCPIYAGTHIESIMEKRICKTHFEKYL